MADTGITMYGTASCADCIRAKRFLDERRIPYTSVDVDADPEALAFVRRVNDGRRIIPVVVFEDGSTLVEPTNAELAAKLGPSKGG